MADIGDYRIGIKGEWDIDDLYTFAEVFQETYAYFYFVTEEPVDTAVGDITAARIRNTFESYFWSGRTPGPWFARTLYDLIPPPRLALRRIEYSSPGFIEFAGILGVLYLIAKVLKMWADAGDSVMNLIERIEKFFTKSGFDRRRRSTEITEDTAKHIDEGRELAFEMGEMIGLRREAIERLIDLTGNPISAVRVLVTLTREARRLIEMQEQGKLEKLPVPEDTKE